MANSDLPFDINRFKVHEDLLPTVLVDTGVIQAVSNGTYTKDWDNLECDDLMQVERYTIEGYNNRELPIVAFRRKELAGQELPGYIYLHGGGYWCPWGSVCLSIAKRIALDVDCAILAVDFALAKEHPFPASVEDTYIASEWIWENAEMLKINREKIAIAGDSSGANLAAAVCQMARDRKSKVKFCLQALMIPGLDNTFSQESYLLYDQPTHPGINSKTVEYVFEIYLRDGIPEGMKASYAAPLQAESFENLPPAYIETADYDPMRDEGIDYATNLTLAGVPATLVQTRRTPHTWMGVESSYTEKYKKFRSEFLKKVFYES
ncbi:MAG: alpha/beta hydrolase [Eubacteriaceae bacterium]|nr:alpha/beta hydrolase [Eubacteriaceae bacterium]